MKDFVLKDIKNCLILGGGAIGSALANIISSQVDLNNLFVTRRNDTTSNFKLPNGAHLIGHDPLNESSWEDLVKRIESKTETLDLVISTFGLLHNQEIQPEKKLQDIELKSLIDVFSINAFTAPLAGNYLSHFFSRTTASAFIFLSAKVGSISDNKLGGWYAYRASKTALNMFVKNISIEFQNKNLNTVVMAIHPGTTSSPLSDPYTKGVNLKIWKPEESAMHICEVIQHLEISDTGRFKNWDSSSLPW